MQSQLRAIFFINIVFQYVHSSSALNYVVSDKLTLGLGICPFC